MDETYLGGRHWRKDGFRKKAAIMGMTKRGGKIRAFQVPDGQTHTVLKAMKKHVHKGSHVMSDDAGVYRKLVRVGYHSHNSIKHGKRHWVRGIVHTNSIESFWALFKRNYHGTYHSMSKKHLQKYIDEVCFRFNNRDKAMQYLFEEATRRMGKNGRLPLRKLTA